MSSAPCYALGKCDGILEEASHGNRTDAARDWGEDRAFPSACWVGITCHFPIRFGCPSIDEDDALF